MKILHINSYGFRGGAETVFRMTKEIPEFENYSGFVITQNEEKADIAFQSWETSGKFFGIFQYIFSYKNYKLLKNFLLTNNISVIHLHGVFASLSPSVLKAIKEIKHTRKIKVLQTLHDFHLICPNAGLFNFNTNKLCEKCIGKKFKYLIFTNNCDRRGIFYSYIKGVRSFISNNILKHQDIVDTFICPSEFMKSKLLQEGINEDKLIVVRNPVNINEGTNIPPKKNLICFFGRFSKEKNLEFLIEAFSLWKEQTHNDFQFMFIGEGEEEEYIKNIAKNSIVKADIKFQKYLQHDKLINEIKFAKYFSMSTKCYENAPMSIIESISLDIIPIVPDLGGMKESIEVFAGDGIAYIPGNKNSWVNTINKIENNYKTVLHRISTNKEIIINQMSIENYYQQISKEYL